MFNSLARKTIVDILTLIEIGKLDWEKTVEELKSKPSQFDGNEAFLAFITPYGGVLRLETEERSPVHHIIFPPEAAHSTLNARIYLAENRAFALKLESEVVLYCLHGLTQLTVYNPTFDMPSSINIAAIQEYIIEKSTIFSLKVTAGSTCILNMRKSDKD